MVPKGWSYCRLEELSKIIDCKHRTPVYVADGVPVISPGTIKWGPIDLVTPVKRVTYEDYQSLMDHCQIDIGDLVMSRNQSVGVVSYIDKNQPFVLGQDTVLLKPRHIDSSFLFQFFQSVPFQTAITKQSGGSTFARINLGVIKELTIVTPPLPEQRKIAQILSIWDKAIATTERLLANKQQQKKALMQRLLTGKQRFSGFEGEWKTVKFEDVLKIEIGGTPSRAKPEYWDEQKVTNNRWLSIANLQGSRIFDTSEYISDLGVSNSNVALIPRGTIVMSFKLTIGRRAILMNDCYTNEAICALIIKDRAVVSNDFLYQAIELVDFESEIDQAIKGKTLNKEKLKRLKLLLPNIEEQHKIASTLSVADAEIATIQNQLDNLKLQKKALMQQLLTGKRRVKVDEAAA